MSVLGLYAHLWYDAPESDDEDEDDQPTPPREALTVAGGLVWWSDAPILESQD